MSTEHGAGARSRTAVRIAAAVAGFVVAGCSGDGGADPESGAWSATVDTLANGAVHVVHTPPPAGARPDHLLVEELRIGAVEGDSPAVFGQVKGVAPLPDGGVAVLDARAFELRIFGPDGTHRATFGGQGEGPGQLMGPLGVERLPGGRLLVPDHANARMSVFDPEAGFVESHRVTFFRYGWVWDGRVTADGGVAKPSWSPATGENVLRVFGPDLTLRDSLPMPADPPWDRDDPPSAWVVGSGDSGARAFYSVPWYPRAQEAIDPEPALWTTAPDDPSYRIVRWVPGGDTTTVVEVRRPLEPVTAAERDSVYAERAEEIVAAGGGRPDPSKIPEVKPAVEHLFVDDTGLLWARIPGGAHARTWDRFHRDGRFAGTVATDLRVDAWIAPVVDGDRVWLVVPDAMGVQYVVRARLRPADQVGDPTEGGG